MQRGFFYPLLMFSVAAVAIVQSGNQAFGGTRIGALKAPRGQNYCALQGKGTYIKQVRAFNLQIRYITGDEPMWLQQVAGERSSMIVQFYASARDGKEFYARSIHMDT